MCVRVCVGGERIKQILSDNKELSDKEKRDKQTWSVGVIREECGGGIINDKNKRNKRRSHFPASDVILGRSDSELDELTFKGLVTD